MLINTNWLDLTWGINIRSNHHNSNQQWTTSLLEGTNTTNVVQSSSNVTSVSFRSVASATLSVSYRRNCTSSIHRTGHGGCCSIWQHVNHLPLDHWQWQLQSPSRRHRTDRRCRSRHGSWVSTSVMSCIVCSTFGHASRPHSELSSRWTPPKRYVISVTVILSLLFINLFHVRRTQTITMKLCIWVDSANLAVGIDIGDAPISKYFKWFKLTLLYDWVNHTRFITYC